MGKKKKEKETKIDFIPFDISGNDENNYVKSKAFFLEQVANLESAIKRHQQAILEAEKTKKSFELLIASLKDEEPDYDTSHLESIVHNYDTTIEQLEKGYEKQSKALERTNTIIQDCFTETVIENVAHVSEKGKIFSTYFVLVLDELE